MSRFDSSPGPASPRRRSDLRFAGLISAGMIATVLTLAALIAPLLAWHGSNGPNARERSQTVRLSEPAARTVPSPGTFSIDRSARIAAGAAGRLVMVNPASRAAAERRATAESPGLSERLGTSQPSKERTHSPQGTAPPASASSDTDGDGLPDAWERRYGLDPDNAADAAEDTDGDGLDNLTELRIRTTPNGVDSDGNGVPDGDEDSDADGLRNGVEVAAASNPWEADSNGDGVTDAQDDPDGDGAVNLSEQLGRHRPRLESRGAARRRADRAVDARGDRGRPRRRGRRRGRRRPRPAGPRAPQRSRRSR